MDPAPEPTRSIAELQPLREQVPDGWLDGVAEAEAQRLAELTADRELLDRLMWSGYGGHDYNRFADRLARYGYAVIHAWCCNELIFARCAAKGLSLHRARIRPDDAAELAMETVAVALKKFRETVLIPRKWDHTRGASLNTFFVGQCLLRFPNVYRRWYRESRPLELVECVETPFDRSERDFASDPEHRSVLRSEAASALDDIDDVLTRAIVTLKAEDRTNEEVAELCQVSLSVVKSRLYRLQQRRDRGDAA